MPGKKGSQPRKGGKFASNYNELQLYELVALVCRAANATDPQSVSQPVFDRHAPGVAQAQGWDPPPQAHAITMRLGKSWAEVKKRALSSGSVEHVLRQEKAARPAPWMDERHIVYALKRVAGHLGKETLFPFEYESGQRELVAEAKRLRREATLPEILPTRNQILVLLEGDWAMGLRLAEMPVPESRPGLEGLGLLRLAEHYYETQGQLPETISALRQHANGLGLAFAEAETKAIGGIEPLVDELIAARAARGLHTGADGPLIEERLDERELAALLAGAQAAGKRNRWRERENVVAAFVEFVQLFDGKQKLGQSLYLSHRKAHGWPSNQAYQQHGRFQDLVAEARTRLKAAQQAA